MSTTSATIILDDVVHSDDDDDDDDSLGPADGSCGASSSRSSTLAGVSLAAQATSVMRCVAHRRRHVRSLADALAAFLAAFLDFLAVDDLLLLLASVESIGRVQADTSKRIALAIARSPRPRAQAHRTKSPSRAASLG